MIFILILICTSHLIFFIPSKLFFLMEQFVLPDNQLLGKEQAETEELPVISQRIQDIIEVLNNFKELGDHER